MGVLVCAAQESFSATNAPQEQVEEYLNPGATVVVNAGRRFVLRLRSNPTTGYGWQLAGPLDEKIVVLVTNDYIQPDTKLAGAGGHEVWVFKAMGRGQAEVALKYVRPWEKDQPPADTNVFKVVVK